MSITTSTERHPAPIQQHISSKKIVARRRRNEMTATLTTFGRTTPASRQEVANDLATITETAVVTKVSSFEYLVTFTVTHRIVPIESEPNG